MTSDSQSVTSPCGLEGLKRAVLSEFQADFCGLDKKAPQAEQMNECNPPRNLNHEAAEAAQTTTSERQTEPRGTTTTTSDELKRAESERQEKLQLQLADQIIKPTRKRYAILVMFIVLHIVKSFQWICLASITNMVAKFYHVDNLAINWSTILFMVTFLVLALPISWLIDFIGLRRSVVVGSLGVAVGVTIKCFSCHRDGFALSMLGHLIIGLAEPFFFSSYAQVSSIWFPDHQVAMATAASIIGEQAGLALGFIIPPLMIGNNSDDFETIERGLNRLFLSVAIITLVNTCSIILFFDEKPKYAPGIARQKQIYEEHQRRLSAALSNQQPAEDHDGRQRRRRPTLVELGRRLGGRMGVSLREQFKLSCKFLTNKHFLCLLAGFGILEGTAYAIHTLLNQMIVGPADVVQAADDSSHHQAQQQQTPQVALLLNASSSRLSLNGLKRWQPEETNLIVGNAGLILIVAGLCGSGACGFLLDRYHRYKLTIATVYLAALVAMAAMTASLVLENELLLYLVIIPLGFAFTGYASCSFDYAVEITYPKPELISSTLLNMSAQIFGIPISLAGSLIVDHYGGHALGVFFCAILLAGFVVTLLQGGRLKRQQTIKEGALQQQQQQQQQEQQQHKAQHPLAQMAF